MTGGSGSPRGGDFAGHTDEPEGAWAVVRGQSADEATFDKLIQIPERGCIVHNTLAGGVRVEATRR